MSLKPIGFYASVKWQGEDEVYDYYFSFGEFDEPSWSDTLGVHDDKVFYYTRPDLVDSLYEYTYEGWAIITDSITYIYNPKEVL